MCMTRLICVAGYVLIAEFADYILIIMFMFFYQYVCVFYQSISPTLQCDISYQPSCITLFPSVKVSNKTSRERESCQMSDTVGLRDVHVLLRLRTHVCLNHFIHSYNTAGYVNAREMQTCMANLVTRK